MGIKIKMMELLGKRNAATELLMVSIVEVGLDKHVEKLHEKVLKYVMLKVKLLHGSRSYGKAIIKKPSHLVMENKDK